MKPGVLSLHHFIKAAILFGFAMYILYLVKTDHILYYIAPRMVDYVKWSSVAFYIVAIYQIYIAINILRGKEQDCDCEHLPSSSFIKNSAIYGLFVFPLLLGFLLPDSTMGSSLASKKGMNLSSANTVKKDSNSKAKNKDNIAQDGSPVETSSGNVAANASNSDSTSNLMSSDAKLDEMFPAQKFTKHYAKYAKELYKSGMISVKEDMYIEALTTMDLYNKQFIGKKMELDGFVYRQEDMKDNQFVVGRFALQCCSADASPFGILTEYDHAKVLAADSWIHATGTIQKTTYQDTEVMMLKLEKFEKIEAPKSNYVYPNPDFGW